MAVELKAASTRARCAVPGGLLGLATELCGAEAWKRKSIQMSRWDLYPLSEAQAKYAALDAFWGHACLDEIERRIAAGVEEGAEGEGMAAAAGGAAAMGGGPALS